jgi:allantoinase
MPLNSIPPTTTVANLTTKREAAQGQCWVDVGFWGGVVPGNEGGLVPLVKAGVKGFKCFLIESGVDVSMFLELVEACVDVNENDLHKAMSALKVSLRAYAHSCGYILTYSCYFRTFPQY